MYPLLTRFFLSIRFDSFRFVVLCFCSPFSFVCFTCLSAVFSMFLLLSSSGSCYCFLVRSSAASLFLYFLHFYQSDFLLGKSSVLDFERHRLYNACYLRVVRYFVLLFFVAVGLCSSVFVLCIPPLSPCFSSRLPNWCSLRLGFFFFFAFC